MRAFPAIMYLMMYIKKLLGLLLVFFLFFTVARATYAVSYSLFPPTNALTQGGQAQFVITIDTQGSSVNNGQVGLTYDTSVLQYQSTSPGASMSSVEVSQIGTGTLLLNGANGSGFSGTGDFATVTFTIIATASGSTQLCTLFTPSGTPAPTTPAGVVPTSLPQSGSVSYAQSVALAGVVLLVLFVGVRLFVPHSNFAKKWPPKKNRSRRS
jgi:Cohesin domain